MPFAGRAERAAFALAAGLGALGFLFFGLGAVGLLAPWSVLVAIALVHILGFRLWRAWMPGPLRFQTKSLAAAAVMGLLLLPVFLLTIYPPTAFDATLYHLPYAQAFMTTHGVPALPDLRYPAQPQLTELTFAALLALFGETAPPLAELAAVLTTALGLYAAGERYSGGGAGLLAAATWLGNPIAAYLGSAALVDAGLALYTTSALLAWVNWDRSRDRRWLVLSGAMAGCAAATKYLGLMAVVLLGLATALRMRREGARPLVLFMAVASLILAPWYARIALLTGSPVFPFLPDVFGGHEWWPSGKAVLPAGDRTVPVGAGGLVSALVGHLVSRPLDAIGWPITYAFDREALRHQSPLSPVYVLLYPLAAVASVRVRTIRRCLLFALAWGVPWTHLEVRYVLPGVAALSLAGGVALASMLKRLSWPRPSGRTTAVMALLLVAPGPAYASYRLWRQGAPPVSAAARDDYLARSLPAYPAVAHLNRQYASRYTVYALHAENLHYFAQGRFLGDWFGPARFDTVLPHLRHGESLLDRLRELGADHLLVGHPEKVELPSDTAFLSRFHMRLRGAGFILFEMAPEGGLDAGRR